jgi:hypothetical protein
MPRSIRARLRFLTTQEGGRVRAPEAGVRPQLKVGEIFTSCIIHPLDEANELALGQEHEVMLEVVFWDEYRRLFHDGMLLELYEGSKKVASGQFLDKLST